MIAVRIGFALAFGVIAALIFRAAWLTSERFFYTYDSLSRRNRIRVAAVGTIQSAGAILLGLSAILLMIVESLHEFVAALACLAPLSVLFLPVMFLGTLWQGFMSDRMFRRPLRSMAIARGLSPAAPLSFRLNMPRGGALLALRLMSAGMLTSLTLAVLWLLPLAAGREGLTTLDVILFALVALVAGLAAPDLLVWLQRREAKYREDARTDKDAAHGQTNDPSA